jgi:hypothetical protein
MNLRSDKVSLGTEEVRVPDAEKTTNSGDVLLERSVGEVVVHGVGTSQELVEVVVSDVKSHAEADRRPNTVAATDPVAEAEHVLGVDAELLDLLGVGGESNEVLSDGGLVLCGLKEPPLGGVGVGDGLCGGEGLAGNKEEGGLRVTSLESLGHVGAVDVGDKVELHALLAVRLEGLGDHDGAKVRSTNTNVDNGVDGLAGVTLPLTRANLLGELLHVVQHAVDLLDYALAVDLHGLVGGVAQGHVVDGASLCEVDLLALEHVIAELLDLCLLGELDQQLEGLLGDEVLGEIEKDIVAIGLVLEGVAEFVEALGVCVEDAMLERTRNGLIRPYM